MQFTDNAGPDQLSQADEDLRCPLTESIDIVYVDEQRLSRTECARSSESSMFAYSVRTFFHVVHYIYVNRKLRPICTSTETF